ncbi:DUF2200 family protein [Chryseobacterium luteum]|nr:DUF2200 family protein [Chryseobacterium luteum]
MHNTRIYATAFASVYLHYIQKAEKKGCTKSGIHDIYQTII